MRIRHSAIWDAQGIFKLVLILVLGALSLLFHAWLRTRVVMTGFEVEQSRKTRARLDNDYLELKAIRESKMSSARLGKMQERLAEQGEIFLEAKPEQILFLPEPETQGQVR